MRRALLAVSLALTGLALSACARPVARAPGPVTTTEPTVSVAASETSEPGIGPAEGTIISPPSAQTVPLMGEDAAPEEGEHDAYVVKVDEGRPRRITVDYVQLFTGAEAERAATQADEQLPPGLRHYIRNTNERTYTFPLASGVRPPKEGGRKVVYRITVKDGAVVGIFARELP